MQGRPTSAARLPRRAAVGWGAATGLALLCALQWPTGASATPTATPGAGAPLSHAAAPVARPSSVASTSFVDLGSARSLPGSFWGTTVPVDAAMPANESSFLAATPARWTVWPGGGFGDRYDPIHGILYSHSGTAGGAPSNESDFVRLCRATNCSAIVQVPGEIDDPSFGAAVVQYTEQTLGFFPSYWEIGNEPGLWTHYNRSWAAWGGNATVAPTPTQYALEVGAYITAMRAVDPSVRVIGFPGGGQGARNEVNWLSAVAKIDGTNVSAYSIHVYPAGLGRAPHPTLGTFFATLNGTNSLPVRVPADRAAIAAACSACAALPLFVTEVGSAVLSGPLNPFVEGFPDAVYIGAEAVQAIDANVSNLDYFAARFGNPGAWENLTGTIRPVYQLYTELLDRLGPTVQPLAAQGPAGAVYALETTRSVPFAETDLLVVNANATETLQIASYSLPGLPAGSMETWSWNGSTAEPTVSFLGSSLPSTLEVGPASLLLLEVVPGGAWPVTVGESGLAPGTRWYIAVGGTLATSATPAIAFFLPNGSYPVGPYSTVSGGPGLRTVESGPADVTVAGATAAVEVRFTPQYFLTTNATPASAGTVVPGPEWVNASAPILVRADARAGFVLEGWVGQGPGAYSGPAANFTLASAGPVREVAAFLAAFPVTFALAGLPAQTPLVLTVDGVSRALANDRWSGLLSNGTHRWNVTAPTGYAAAPANGSFTVAGLPLEVTVDFDRDDLAVAGAPPVLAGQILGPTGLVLAGLAALVAAIGLNAARQAIDRRRAPGRTPLAPGTSPGAPAPGPSVAPAAGPATISEALQRDIRQRCWAAAREIEALPPGYPGLAELLAQLPPVLQALTAGNAGLAHERLGKLEHDVLEASERSTRPSRSTEPGRGLP